VPGRKILAECEWTGNNWDNNGPMVQDSIKKTAGLEEKFNSAE
jgi:hypothetical protein